MMNPLLYNRSVCKEYVDGKTDEYSAGRGPAIDQEVARDYLGLMKFFNSFGKSSCWPVFDRSGVLPCFINITNDSPLPKSWDCPLSYSDICELQANRMIATGKRIVVYWSGGTDSTLVLVSLLKAGIKPEQVFVVLSQESVAEYPWFYDTVVSKLPSVLLGPPTILANRVLEWGGFEATDLLTTGNLAEAVLHFGRVSSIMTDRDWRGVVPQRVQEFCWPLIQACPRPINSIYEFSWWIRFCMYWPAFKYLWTCYLPKPPGGIMSFWDCDEFQAWSLHNHKLQWRDDQPAREYKVENKQIIIDYTKDESYWAKTRKLSLTINFKAPNQRGGSWGYLLPDLSTVGTGDDMKMVQTS